MANNQAMAPPSCLPSATLQALQSTFTTPRAPLSTFKTAASSLLPQPTVPFQHATTPTLADIPKAAPGNDHPGMTFPIALMIGIILICVFGILILVFVCIGRLRGSCPSCTRLKGEVRKLEDRLAAYEPTLPQRWGSFQVRDARELRGRGMDKVEEGGEFEDVELGRKDYEKGYVEDDAAARRGTGYTVWPGHEELREPPVAYGGSAAGDAWDTRPLSIVPGSGCTRRPGDYS